jgi:ribosomal protein S18 acetylase RimI-like enzyme
MTSYEGAWHHRRVIREATVHDVEGMARVHVESRHTAFRKTLGPEIAEEWTVEERRQTWREYLAREEIGVSAFALVAEREGEIVGIASGGAIRGDEPGHLGEVERLYVGTPHQRTGVGTRLFVALAARLSRAGLEPFVVFTPSHNVWARRFYERLGGRLLKEVQGVSRSGVPVEKVAYAWPTAPPAPAS